MSPKRAFGFGQCETALLSGKRRGFFRRLRGGRRSGPSPVFRYSDAPRFHSCEAGRFHRRRIHRRAQLERSCMGIILSMIVSPVIRRPSLEVMTAEIAQPEGILICPSFFICHVPFLPASACCLPFPIAVSRSEGVAYPCRGALKKRERCPRSAEERKLSKTNAFAHYMGWLCHKAGCWMQLHSAFVLYQTMK